MNAATQERIAREVREERKQRRLTQEELAAMAGVTKNTIGNMERGLSFPQHSNLVTICGLMGISPDEDGDQDETESPSEQPVVHDGGWSPDVRVALNVIGLYLESYAPLEREQHIASIVRDIMARRL